MIFSPQDASPQQDKAVPHLTSRPPLWLFDLDNTLHDASHAVFPGIVMKMNAYMAQVLGTAEQPASAAEVERARIAYWQRYGATLLGLVKHHGVRADHFLRETHALDNLTALLRFEQGLARRLAALPGRKVLLTNAPLGYSRAVLRHLRLQRHFDHHIAIEHMQVHRQLRPKPSALMLRRLLRRHGVPARRCVLVEDTLANLKSARRLGVRTVWVTQYVRASAPGEAQRSLRKSIRPGYVDVKVQSVRQLGQVVHRLCPRNSLPLSPCPH
jgi:putative hydrolase of the HAD superfamily